MLADKGLRPRGEMQVAGPMVAGIDQQLADRLGEAVVIEGRDLVEGELGRIALGPRLGSGRGLRQGRGGVVEQRVARGRADCGAGDGILPIFSSCSTSLTMPSSMSRWAKSMSSASRPRIFMTASACSRVNSFLSRLSRMNQRISFFMPCECAECSKACAGWQGRTARAGPIQYR